MAASWSPPVDQAPSASTTSYYDLNTLVYSSEPAHQLANRRTITVASVMHAADTSSLPTAIKLLQARLDAHAAVEKFGPLDVLLFPGSSPLSCLCPLV